MNKVKAEYTKKFTIRLSEEHFAHVKKQDNPSEYIRELLNNNVKTNSTKEG